MLGRVGVCAALIGLLIAGCAGVRGASEETKSALAPTGKLRVASIISPIYATKDASTGELKGVAVDLGRDLARRLEVPYVPVVYANPPALMDAAKSGQVDVVLMGINAERAAVLDFSPPYMEVEQTYLVRAGAPVSSIAEIDKAGVRIGVLEKAGADVLLSRTLKNATLVRATSGQELMEMLRSGRADAIAATTSTLLAEAQRQPGTRVLEGRFLVEPLGMGVPKGRNTAAAAYVADFVERAKAEGVVKASIDRSGLRGVAVAPPKN